LANSHVVVFFSSGHFDLESNADAVGGPPGAEQSIRDELRALQLQAHLLLRLHGFVTQAISTLQDT
jgi:hypothetical protein